MTVPIIIAIRLQLFHNQGKTNIPLRCSDTLQFQHTVYGGINSVQKWFDKEDSKDIFHQINILISTEINGIYTCLGPR